ncbi:hypothetical protein [Priestia megaterium]|uniref:hypothetical protein n=1 Tax=Priestia megaterium TaxID=1404 RepID=UPI0011287312|nr:hypothetical protein [Priestia megaterium]TPF18027.1 hypothetical protein CBE78_02030 [Priestia megaterium]TPF22134.1 hypothetical protein CBE79_04535 [Priestia megaterium]
MNRYNLNKERQKEMDKYMLLKDIPLVKAGAIFVHDKEDNIRGSIGSGCLKLAWTDDGNCQRETVNNRCAGLCADTIVFHAIAKDDSEWFVKVKNEDKYKGILNNFVDKLGDLVDEFRAKLK